MVCNVYILAFDFFLALTPVQKWGAARQFNTNVIFGRWFVLGGIVVIIALVVVLFVIGFRKSGQEQKDTRQLFAEYAEKMGLSDPERQILLDIARQAGLKRNESVFTLSTAFDRGAAKIIEKAVAQHSTEAGEQLKTQLAFLREKLGFRTQPSTDTKPFIKSRKLSSRQVSVGRKLYMARPKAGEAGNIGATVVRNTKSDLAVKLTQAVKVTFGESWCVRYYFGTSVWEFDTTVVSYDGDILVLNHSDDARFINRRRFLRVPVRKQAFIAHFPFAKTVAANSDSSKEQAAENSDWAEISTDTWGPPQFVPAVVTELAGPGLRIESALQVEVGERILVIFSLAEQEHQDGIVPEQQGTARAKVVEDIGEVKHIKAVENGLLIAVELTGLSDLDVDELVCITNAALLKISDENKDVPASESAEEDAVEQAAARGA